MLFLSVLIVAFVALRLVASGRLDRRDQARAALAAGMAVAGVAHFAMPTPFVQHLPPWVPGRLELVYVSGAAEIALGASLVGPSRWHAVAGRTLAAYLLAVFPANIYVAVASVDVVGQPGGPYPWLRLPLQFLFIWLALWSTSDRREGGTSRPSAQWPPQVA
jgi:uncharacterized membrane protein